MALGLDEYTLLTKMQAAKDSIVPSIDDCTLTEIENFVAELHHEHNLNKDEIIDSLVNQNENGGSGDVQTTKAPWHCSTNCKPRKTRSLMIRCPASEAQTHSDLCRQESRI